MLRRRSDVSFVLRLSALAVLALAAGCSGAHSGAAAAEDGGEAGSGAGEGWGGAAGQAGEAGGAPCQACAGADSPGALVRVSATSSGEDANGESQAPAVSGDGRFIAFESHASNLVSDDPEGHQDIFVYDRETAAMERVSVSSSGDGADATSHRPAISPDGRFVTFHSYATNLAPGGNDSGVAQVFVRDRQAGTTERVSLNADGEAANFHCDMPVVSGDGRWVFFESLATNLEPPDTNLSWDVFAVDRQEGAVERLSVSRDGGLTDGDSGPPSISPDGRFVVFPSLATNLVEGDGNDAQDVFVLDRDSGVTERVSVSSSGDESDGFSYGANISADGRFVVFQSDATNLVERDANAVSDIFIHDREGGSTERVSVASDGTEADGPSQAPTVSADGRFVAFESAADNLVAGDDNGQSDVFVRDTREKRTWQLSRAPAGSGSDGPSLSPSISAAGDVVTFASKATNLVSGDRNGDWDVFASAASEP